MNTELITNISLGSVLLVIIAFLARSIIKQVLDKDLENYKTKISAEAEKIRFEHQVKFSKLHEKRGEVIVELYHKLIEANNAVLDIASPYEYDGELSKKGKALIAGKKIDEFRKFSNRNNIYFSKELNEKLTLLYIELVAFEIHLEKMFKDCGENIYSELNDKQRSEKLLNWKNSWDNIYKGKAHDALEAMKDEFRKLLGVE